MSDFSEQQIQMILNIIEREIDLDAREITKILLESDRLLTVEEIEQKLKEDKGPIDLKHIRQALYAMNDLGYARSRRIRDKETGWIKFLWDLFPEKILDR